MQTSNWSRGLFGTANQDMRVSDAERQAVADRLAVHYADGRLDQAEFDERTGRAISAKTRADLDGLLDDLPEPPSTLGTGASGASGIPAYSSGGPVTRRHRHGHPLLAVAVIVVIVLTLGHAFWLFASWLWIGIIALIVLAATGHLGHHHHHHHDHRPVDDL
jgi:uncharacterized membrane protein YccC